MLNNSTDDQAFFKAFFYECYEELVVHANGYLFNKAASEDVVQEVFIKLWEKVKLDEISVSLKAYTYSMVKNHCLNELKRKKITDFSTIIELNEPLVVDFDEEPFLIDKGKVLYDQVLQIVDTLPDRMQEIFKLKFFSNYKYSEIADELGISVNTVKIQLKRAKSRIGQMMIFLALLFTNLWQ